MTMTAFLMLLAAHLSMAHAATFRVLGVQGQVLLEQRVEAVGTLGQVSNAALEAAVTEERLDQYLGSEQGVNAINHLGSALEVLSDTVLNAYGWCYRVDGHASDLLANEYFFTGQETLIEWFYAYARFERTAWTAMCIPAKHVPVE